LFGRNTGKQNKVVYRYIEWDETPNRKEFKVYIVSMAIVKSPQRSRRKITWNWDIVDAKIRNEFRHGPESRSPAFNVIYFTGTEDWACWTQQYVFSESAASRSAGS
jgi:hypothetical protein